MSHDRAQCHRGCGWRDRDGGCQFEPGIVHQRHRHLRDGGWLGGRYHRWFRGLQHPSRSRVLRTIRERGKNSCESLKDSSPALDSPRPLLITRLSHSQVLRLEWWPISRDALAYAFTVLLLILTLWDGRVEWYEALVLVACYILYISGNISENK